MWLRAELVVGFCGGCTTFSTFTHETLGLTETGATGTALATVVVSVPVGLLADLPGTRLGRVA